MRSSGLPGLSYKRMSFFPSSVKRKKLLFLFCGNADEEYAARARVFGIICNVGVKRAGPYAEPFLAHW